MEALHGKLWERRGDEGEAGLGAEHAAAAGAGGDGEGGGESASGARLYGLLRKVSRAPPRRRAAARAAPSRTKLRPRSAPRSLPLSSSPQVAPMNRALARLETRCLLSGVRATQTDHRRAVSYTHLTLPTILLV